MTIAHAAREDAVHSSSLAIDWGATGAWCGVSQANGWLRRKSVLIVAAAALMTYEALRQRTRSRLKKSGDGGKGVHSTTRVD